MTREICGAPHSGSTCARGAGHLPPHRTRQGMDRIEQASRRARDRYVASGFCEKGDGEPLASQRLCVRHLAAVRRRAAEWVSRGLCSNGDGRPLASGHYCRDCLDRHERYVADLYLAGLCREGDGRPRANGTTYCDEHLLTKMHNGWRREAAVRTAAYEALLSDPEAVL